MRQGLKPFTVEVEQDVRLFVTDKAVNDVGRACRLWLDARGLTTPGEFAARQRLSLRYQSAKREGSK